MLVIIEFKCNYKLIPYCFLKVITSSKISTFVSELKRKRKSSGSCCNGTSSPKRLLKNVLRLSGEDKTAGEQVPTPANQEEHEKHVDLENVDHCIVQFMVGGDDGTEDWVSVMPCNLEAEDVIKNDKQSSSSRHESTSQTSPTEPSKYTNTLLIISRIC